MASSRRIARETRGRGPQTVGRAAKCTAARERTATRGDRTDRAMPRDPCSPQNPGATFGLLADATASEANFPELERPNLLPLTAASGGPKRNVLHTCGCTCGI